MNIKELIERKKRILGFMKEKAYKPLLFEELIMVLDVPEKDREIFKDFMDELVSEGEVVKTRRGRYCIPEGKALIKGTIRSSGKGYAFLIPEDTDQEDVFIPGDFLNSAMNNDTVIVRVNKKALDGKRSEGEIVKIVKRGTQTVVGVFDDCKHYGFVVPDIQILDKDIFIPKHKTGGAKDGQKVVARITVYPEKRRSAEGEIVEILGYPDEAGVDVMSVVRSFGVPMEFPEQVLREAEGLPTKVTEDMIKGRRDLRDMLVVTIDGEDAKDLDDGVSVKLLEDGNYQLVVHIADVSHYVREGSLIDKEALLRGTSVYFVDRVIPMLPKALSNGICSLNPNEDRLAFSVSMIVDRANGKVLDYEIFESVIRSRKRMTYTQVYKIVEEKDPEVIEKFKELVPSFELMKELALVLKDRRIRRGAIEFEFAEAQVIVDEKGKAIDIEKREMTIANSIIEEFMLLANETVAQHFYWGSFPFIYRIHEDPTEEKVNMFRQFIYNLGYKLKGSGKPHPRSYQDLLIKAKGSNVEKIISAVMLRSLQKARYSSQYDKHFGLAAEYYSHFTSPIRRYPDLQIHRLMKEYLKKGISEKRREQLNARLPDIALMSSDSERRAIDAERAVEDKKKVEYMKQFVGDEFEGVISSVTSFGFFIELENTCEGLVHISSLDDDYYIYEEERYRLIGENTRKIYSLGDTVKAILVKADTLAGELDFELVED